ncbi:hypothetical protein GEMRC1_011997 [Eukaryota sp. GEM-RC1]
MPSSFITTTGYEETNCHNLLQPLNVESTITKLLETRQRERDAHQELERVRAIYREQSAALDVLESELIAKQQSFANTKKSSNPKEALAKLHRAHKRFDAERHAIALLETEIKEAKQTLSDLNAEVHSLQASLSALDPYKNYIESVIMISSDFSSTKDVMNRYTALQRTNEQLQQQQEKLESQSAEHFSSSVFDDDALLSTQLVNDNKTHKIRQRLDTLIAENDQLEHSLFARTRNVQHHLATISSANLALTDLFTRVSSFFNLSESHLQRLDAGDESLLEKLSLLKGFTKTMLDIKVGHE